MLVQPVRTEKVNLLDLDRAALRDFFVQNGEKSFRADQIMQWIYQQGCDDFSRMSNLNQPLRAKLQQLATVEAPEIATEQRASDGTLKWAMSVGEQQVETVYIPGKRRGTLCVSSQVGCALACRFCSTAQQGFNRNLRVSEIIGQVWRATQRLEQLSTNSTETGRRAITNIVMMGMGEPLLNLSQVVPAMRLMLDDWGFGLSKRRVTLSTSGVVPALEKLAGMIDVALAISLHAPEDSLRDQLVPINRKYNIADLLVAVRRYLQYSNANHGGVTVEYVMLHQVNDSIEQAHQLAFCLHNTPSKINLIPWNAFPGAPYRCSTQDNIAKFAAILSHYGFVVTVRKPRGSDIDAACGQLAGEVLDRTKRRVRAVPLDVAIPIKNLGH